MRPVSGSTTLRMTLCRASHSSLVMGFMAWMRDFCSSVRTGRGQSRAAADRGVPGSPGPLPHPSGQQVPGPPSSSSPPAARCHWSSDGPGSASAGALAFSLPFFFSFFFLRFFFLFLSLCFPRFLRPRLEDEEEEDEEDEELEEEEEEELERGLLRALRLLLSAMREEVRLQSRAGRRGPRPADRRSRAAPTSDTPRPLDARGGLTLRPGRVGAGSRAARAVLTAPPPPLLLGPSAPGAAAGAPLRAAVGHGASGWGPDRQSDAGSPPPLPRATPTRPHSLGPGLRATPDLGRGPSKPRPPPGSPTPAHETRAVRGIA